MDKKNLNYGKKSWEISDEFWEFVKSLIPKVTREKGKRYKRRKGGGRKPLDPKRIFGGIIFVLRTGCQWKAIPKEIYGSSSSIHKYFREWLKAGFFQKLWEAGLAEFDDMEGIAWAWQSIDGAMMKAPLAQETVGKNPTDRGKKWEQKEFVSRRAWNPAIDSRNRSEST